MSINAINQVIIQQITQLEITTDLYLQRFYCKLSISQASYHSPVRRTDYLQSRSCNWQLSSTSQPQNETLMNPAELLKLDKVLMEDLYLNEQILKIKMWNKEEKVKNQYRTCGTYFYTTENCQFEQVLCFKCHKFGHCGKDCLSKYSLLMIEFLLRRRC